MRTIVASLLFVVTPCSLFAQSSSVERIDVTNFGIYEVEFTKERESKTEPPRSWEVVTKFRNIKTTTTIPARLCISFGFEYRIVGTPIDAQSGIRMITRFPNQGMRNPETRQTVYQTEAVVDRAVGRQHFRSYTLDKAWELVPGVWTFELWHKNRKLAEQSFTLTEPCGDGCDMVERPKSKCEESLVSVASINP
jgi:hypothetical protein